MTTPPTEDNRGTCTKCGLETQPLHLCRCPERNYEDGSWTSTEDRDWTPTDPREHEKRKYRSIWQALNAPNDIYARYALMESLIDGLIATAEARGYERGIKDADNGLYRPNQP